jgi:TetR/AcrR family transcriptional regulator, regulator of cefoperazone and chloramphenicol sensitivity
LTVVAAGRVPDIEIKVRVIALMGQVLTFRTCRAAALRLTGWSDVGDAEGAVIDRVIRAQVTAVLNDLEKGKSL